MSENISTRIHIKYKDGDDISYFTDKEVLHHLGINADKEFTDLFALHVGTIITTANGKKLKIVDIWTHFNRDTHDNSDNYGINIYGVGERFPYNYEVTYEVEEL